MPLMAREFPIYELTSARNVSRSVMPGSPLRDTEVEQRVSEALEDEGIGFPIPNHPVMRPSPGFIQLVRSSPFLSRNNLIMRSAVLFHRFVRPLFCLYPSS